MRKIEGPRALFADDQCEGSRLSSRVTAHTLQAVNGGWSVGRSNAYLKDLALDTFVPIYLYGGTRSEKFTEAVTGCIKRGAGAGACVGVGVSYVPDLLLGNANPNYQGCGYDLFAEGVVGGGAHAVIDVVSTVATAPGAVIGFLGGLSVSPCVSVDSESEELVAPKTKKHKAKPSTARTGATIGADVTSTIVAAAVSAPTGIALGAARIPFAIAKGACALVGAIVGGIVGVFIGAGRAVFNR